MVNGLVVTHGMLGTELVKVMEMIMGPVPGVAAMTNSGKSMIDLSTEIKAWLDSAAAKGEGSILFIDDFGGSCANAAQLAVEGDGQVWIVTGINLAMLLDFVTWREGLEPAELARRIVERGREAVAIVKPSGGKSQ
jgi:mannose/fructose-specific phosphotransferase system component IIA